MINSALKKLTKESQPKLVELVRLDTILNDSIKVIRREIYERDKKGLKKIDVNKIKNVDVFMYHLNIVINNKKAIVKNISYCKIKPYYK